MTARSADSRPVLVVGAGPTGMTAAMELARAGVAVRIVDKLTEPSTTSRALAVQARTLELLGPRGVGEEMVRLGNPAKATTLYGRGKRLAAVELERIPSRHNYILLLSQAETERLLREQLARQGVTIERGVDMAARAQVPGSGVHAVLRHPGGELAELDAPYLRRADGAHSTVRHTLGLPFAGASLPQSYALADLHLDGDLPEDELSIFLGTDGFLAVFPMGGRRFRFIALDPAHDAKDAPDPTLAELQTAYDHIAHVPVQLRDMNWSSRFRINSRHLTTLHVGNVFFAGDSAHVHSPAGGQGMNTGIQDVINLCWKLALVVHGRAEPALLDSYQTDRLPVISNLVRTTETATRAFNSANPVVHQLLTRIAPIALGTEAVQNKGTRVLGEVDSGYRRTPLSAGAGSRGPLHAGDRVPDLTLRHDGAEAPLSALLDLTCLTLLVFEPGDATVTRSSRLPAWREHLRAWDDLIVTREVAPHPEQPRQLAGDADLTRILLAEGGLLLVRPDGYLGAAAPVDDPAVLVSWLTRWFPATS